MRHQRRVYLPRYLATTIGVTMSELLLGRSSLWRSRPHLEMSNSFFGNAFNLLKQTVQEWLQDKAPQLGAALAYYTVFSLAPLILVLLAIVGVIFRHDPAGAWDKITQQMSYFLDPSALQVVQDIARKAELPRRSQKLDKLPMPPRVLPARQIARSG